MQIVKLTAAIMVVAFTLSLSACGGKDKNGAEKESEKKESADKDSGKKDSNGGGSAAGKASKKLIGKWSLDTGDTLSKMEAEAKTEEEKQALEFAKAMISEMDMGFEFTSDGKMIMTMAAGDESETKEGTYEVKSEDESSVVIAGTLDDDTKEVKINLLEDDKIEMVMPDDEGGPGSMVLNRVK